MSRQKILEDLKISEVLLRFPTVDHSQEQRVRRIWVEADLHLARDVYRQYARGSDIDANTLQLRREVFRASRYQLNVSQDRFMQDVKFLLSVRSTTTLDIKP